MAYAIKSLPDMRLTYKDLFVFKPLYRVAHKWFTENGWKDQYGGWQFYEIYYIHRETGGGFYDIMILWEWYKPYMNKNYNMKIQFEFLLLGGNVAERRIGDQKVKGETGELTIFVRPSVDIDSKGFDENPILRNVQKKLFERDVKDISEQVQGYTFSKAKEVYDLMKSYLDSHGSVFGMDTLIHRKFDDL